MSFDLGLLLVAVFGGIIRVGTPYLYVSLGECVTERAGRVDARASGRIRFAGADAASFLHALVTNDVQSLATLDEIVPIPPE